MDEHSIMPVETNANAISTANALEQMAQIMRGMSDMMRATNERMAALEHQVRLLTKVTPAQATQLGKSITERAEQLCTTYRLAGAERKIASCIRRDVRLNAGISAMRELPKCEYQVTMQRIALWDDYKVIKTIRGTLT